jgi:hypothetical protein
MCGGELVGTGVDKGVALGISRVFVGEVAWEARRASGKVEIAWQARRKIDINISRRRMETIIAVSIVAIAGIASR